MPTISATALLQRRQSIDAARAAAGLDGYPWSEPLTTNPPTPIRSVHFNELRVAVQDLCMRKRLGTIPNWTNGTQPGSQRSIAVTDETDPTSWESAYKNSQNKVASQGIVSLSFDPLVINPSGFQGPYQITSDWVTNIYALKPNNAALMIRTNITSNRVNNQMTEGSIEEYGHAVEKYNARNMPVAGVLAGEFDRFDLIVPGDRTTYCPNRGLGYQGDLLKNEYIDHFVARAVAFASGVSSSGLKTFWIWNEPQHGRHVPDPPPNSIPAIVAMNNLETCRANEGEPGTIAPEVFGALLHKASYAIKNAVPGAVVYAGSLSVLPGLDPPGQAGAAAADFLGRMYAYLRNVGLVTSLTPPYGFGWDALSLNVEGLFDTSFVDQVISRIHGVQNLYGDFKPIIVGEWGVQNSIIEDPNEMARVRPTFETIKENFPIMYFFSHHFLVKDDPGDYGTQNYETPDNSDEYDIAPPSGAWRDVLKDDLFPDST
jgi:hypothetical protein